MKCQKCDTTREYLMMVYQDSRNGMVHRYWCMNCVVSQAIHSKFRPASKVKQPLWCGCHRTDCCLRTDGWSGYEWMSPEDAKAYRERILPLHCKLPEEDS